MIKRIMLPPAKSPHIRYAKANKHDLGGGVTKLMSLSFKKPTKEDIDGLPWIRNSMKRPHQQRKRLSHPAQQILEHRILLTLRCLQNTDTVCIEMMMYRQRKLLLASAYAPVTVREEKDRGGFGDAHARTHWNHPSGRPQR